MRILHNNILFSQGVSVVVFLFAIVARLDYCMKPECDIIWSSGLKPLIILFFQQIEIRRTHPLDLSP